ncbi:MULTISPECIES: hypothetical protein [unclassified Achromobacter]|uniref:hypothetical protein n=1 Tax=unclassified Achromobacter TaxID=2626865 RepID=UPI000B518BC8|nr:MULTISPECIES: hypothetical protein [unclassified Achromobacter]OWT73717.1 hypothetical protein CEY05_21750 [Achromobacter sp. HZ34]OWT79367.1 hypothetical protein CEY04_10230 [Achromobacter sp. HZ28]
MRFKEKNASKIGSGMAGSRKALRATVAVASTLASLLVSTSALAAGPDTGLKWSEDPTTHCKFVAPESLGDGPKYWTGSCSTITSIATGVGMILARNGNQAGPAFYGEVRAGIPIIGVVDEGNGYRAGLFDGKEVGLKDSERVDIDDSFEVAVVAAKRVSEDYKRQGNTASAKHYLAVAKTLDKQLDRD